MAASLLDLFRNKSVILTPTEQTSPAAVDRVTSMWRATGALVRTLDAKVHDGLLAVTSHLPHVAAYALVDYVAHHDQSELLFQLAAAGFYDFTRIASSDPVMWRDICVTNPESILQALKGYRSHIDQMIDAIQHRDNDALFEAFKRSKHARDDALASPKQNKS